MDDVQEARSRRFPYRLRRPLADRRELPDENRWKHRERDGVNIGEKIMLRITGQQLVMPQGSDGNRFEKIH